MNDDLDFAVDGEIVGTTPSPWMAEYSQPGIWHINSIHGGMGDIATVWSDEFVAERAHLIAAAPELLAAARMAHDWLTATASSRSLPTLVALKAAIAKAEGREHDSF